MRARKMKMMLTITIMIISNSCTKSISNLSVINKNINDDLIVAVTEGDEEKIIISLSKGANINHKSYNGDTTLMIASRNGHIKLVRLLLEKRANVNNKNFDGSTALMLASLKRLFELEEVADINEKEDECWPSLMIASKNGHNHISLLYSLQKLPTELF